MPLDINRPIRTGYFLPTTHQLLTFQGKCWPFSVTRSCSQSGALNKVIAHQSVICCHQMQREEIPEKFFEIGAI